MRVGHIDIDDGRPNPEATHDGSDATTPHQLQARLERRDGNALDRLVVHVDDEPAGRVEQTLIEQRQRSVDTPNGTWV